MICSDHNKLIISRTYLILWIENRMVTKNSLVLKCFGQHRCWWRHLFISFHVWYLQKCPNWNGEMHNKFPDNNLVLFSRLKSKSRVSVPKFSKQLECQISTTTVFLKRSTQNLALQQISGWYDVISSWIMTSSKILNFRRKSKKQPKMAIYYISFVTSSRTSAL